MASLVAFYNSWKKERSLSKVFAGRVSCKQASELVLRWWPSTISAAPSGFYLLIAPLHYCALVSECVEFLSLTSSLAIKPSLNHPTQSRHVAVSGLVNLAFTGEAARLSGHLHAAGFWASPASEA